MARIMIMGASGYIGNVLVDQLLKENHQVIAVDWMVFGRFPLKPFLDNPNFEHMHQDIREMPVRAFRGVDMICDVAGLPNEQCCALDPALSREINLHARARVARIAKAMGVKRHIAITSCEAYELPSGDTADERTPLGAKSIYVRSNQELEKALLSASTEDFSATVLRAGSVYGLSRRMRFDVIGNLAALHAHMRRPFTLPGGPQSTLPFIHVRDVVRAVQATLNAPEEMVGGQIFNLASQSVSFSDLIDQTADLFPEKLECHFTSGAQVHPEVNVSMATLQEATGFAPRISLEQGMLEVFIALKGGRTQMDETTNTAKLYRSLIENGDESGARRLT